MTSYADNPTLSRMQDILNRRTSDNAADIIRELEQLQRQVMPSMYADEPSLEMIPEHEPEPTSTAAPDVQNLSFTEICIGLVSYAVMQLRHIQNRLNQKIVW